MNWHDFLYYGFIVVALWVGLCLLTAVLSKQNRGAAAGASMLPILIAFAVIALIASADERREKRKKRAIPRAITLAAVPVIVALIYWHAAIFGWLSRL